MLNFGEIISKIDALKGRRLVAFSSVDGNRLLTVQSFCLYSERYKRVDEFTKGYARNQLEEQTHSSAENQITYRVTRNLVKQTSRRLALRSNAIL